MESITLRRLRDAVQSQVGFVALLSWFRWSLLQSYMQPSEAMLYDHG